MKWIMAVGLLFSLCVQAQVPWRPADKPPVAQLTPIAARCDVSACQQNCYIEQSQCQNRQGAGCGGLAQICVQNCTSLCR